ncbi:zinc finger CCCH domain-containing protein 8-like isoform X2 [Aristolochia californica]|uniref:zinc finger CCCH domain-containing protein 8-like isoform X2 n=1 Tax=Aristolochia californica TaxID=171875 RepID=UPI0035DC1A51
MANQLYSASRGGGSLPSAYSSNLDDADPSLLGSSRYIRSEPLSGIDLLRYASGNNAFGLGGKAGNVANRISSGHATAAAGSMTPLHSLFNQSSWASLQGLQSTAAGPPVPGVKRPYEAVYHPSLLGTHNTIEQNEASFATNTLAKRPRFDATSHLPIYPQRPGEKDCAHYMLTRTCRFGDRCKFDHPPWVPEGGIPDWKEVPLIPTSEALPERQGEPDCPYFLKTQKCKFGSKCKFNHPQDKVENASASIEGVSEISDKSLLPERPSEPPCSYYMKTGQCKFGLNCKFHHPKDVPLPVAPDPTSGEEHDSAAASKTTKSFTPFIPALMHNSKGLPIRPGEMDCPFYLKTSSCKYGSTCRYNHPDRYAINPPIAAALSQALMPSLMATVPLGVLNLGTSISNINSWLGQTSLPSGLTIYPQRLGQTECDYYMKTGVCKFGERCKFDHPVDRTAPAPSVMKQALQQSVKLTLAGLPRREGEVLCSLYMKTGICKFGPTCKFDHPPPFKAIAMVTGQAGAATSAAEGTEKEATTTEVSE